MYNKAMSKEKSRWFDWLATICVAVLFLLASTRLGLTNWADNLGVAGWLLLFGGVVGYIIGKWRIHWILLVFLSLIISAVLVSLSFIFMLSEQAGFIPKVLDIWNRISTTFSQLVGNQPVTDSILFLLAMAVLFWFIGLSTGITLVRSGKPWIPLLLLGAVILIIEHYQPDARRTFYSWAYGISLIILLGRIFYLRLHRGFATSDQTIGSETEFEFNRGIIVTALLIGAVTLMVPGIVHIFVQNSKEQTRLTQKWAVFTSKFENAFYSINQSQQSIEQVIGDNMPLGTGQILGKEPVLYIEAYQKNPVPTPFYWRGMAYTTYLNGIWSIPNTYKQSYKPLQQIHDPNNTAGHVELKIWVQSLLPELTQLYATGDVISFNRRMDAAVAVETIFEREILSYYIDPSLKQNEIYRYETDLSVPNSIELSTAGTDYPEWVTSRYLQLPDNISNRMRTLATQLTETKTTPYDKAVAVTQYLRNNIEYQSTIPAPPRKKDPIDWFLFDYKKGFCNYYASADVLLLRLVGVPARLAVGYAQGTSVNTGGGYIIKGDDSHAWPEVYFPGYGWIPFEPTGSRPVLDWSAPSGGSTGTVDSTGSGQTSAGQNQGHLTGEDRANLLLEQMGSDESVTPTPKRTITLFGWIILGVASVLVTGGLILLGIKAKRNWENIVSAWQQNLDNFKFQIYRIPLVGYWFKTRELTAIERNFAIVEFGLIMLDGQMSPGSTAMELALSLQKSIPSVEKEISLLLEHHQRAAYSPHPIDPKPGKAASRVIFKKIISQRWQLFWGKIERMFTH